MVGNNLLGQSIVGGQGAQLDQQAFAHVPRRHAQRVKHLDQRQRFLHVRGLVVAGLGDLFQRCREVTILIQVADDGMAGFAHFVSANRQAQLPFQMVGEGGGLRKEILKRGFLDHLGGGRLVTRVEVIVEERPKVDFFERILTVAVMRGMLGRGGSGSSPPRSSWPLLRGKARPRGLLPEPDWKSSPG